jgi:hypothetical protein
MRAADRQVTSRSVDDLDVLVPSWRLSLEAANRAPRTIDSYLDGTRQFSAFLHEHSMPTDVSAIAREHVEAFVVHIRDTRSASTAETRFRALRLFYGGGGSGSGAYWVVVAVVAVLVIAAGSWLFLRTRHRAADEAHRGSPPQST